MPDPIRVKRYVFKPSRDRRYRMHIAEFDRTGNMTGSALCGRGPFVRSINAPWTLGRQVCADCEKEVRRA